MHISGLLALLLSSALSATPKAEAPKPPRTTAAASATELEIEVVERHGGTPSRFGFVVPIDGSVDAWIDRGDDPRRCEVDVDTTREGLQLELRCSGSPERALRVKARRTLAPGKRTRVAEVTRPGGAKSQVFVTLQ
jgi:hypothetical protein